MRKPLLFSLGLVLGFVLAFSHLGDFERYMNRSRTAGVWSPRIVMRQEHHRMIEATKELQRATEELRKASIDLLRTAVAYRMEREREYWWQMTPYDREVLIQQEVDRVISAAADK